MIWDDSNPCSCKELMQMASGQFINPTACIPFEECPVRTPITIKKLTSLSVNSPLEYLRFTLDQNYLMIAQLIILRLRSSTETQPYSSVPQEFSGASTQQAHHLCSFLQLCCGSIIKCLLDRRLLFSKIHLRIPKYFLRACIVFFLLFRIPNFQRCICDCICRKSRLQNRVFSKILRCLKRRPLVYNEQSQIKLKINSNEKTHKIIINKFEN